MKRNAPAAGALILAAALIWGAPRARADTSCPASVTVEQRGTRVPDGWSAGDSGFHPGLAGVTIYEGPPQEQASLVYDDQKTSTHEITQTWKLSPSGRGYWLECRYSSTTVTLQRKLPASAHHCRAVFERNVSSADGLGVMKTASCGD